MEKKLFMLLLGCRPKGRHTEQHDIYFGIGETLKDLIPGILQWWPGAGEIHIDAWREVRFVDGFELRVVTADNGQYAANVSTQLFFINLGGYKANEFDEFHYKMLVMADSMDDAKRIARTSAFYKHTGVAAGAGIKNAGAHIDDKYGIDVDDVYKVKDLLPPALKT